jgi:PadR family transcriptional regulator PadR
MTLLPGTLDLLVLRALAWEPTHGTGVGDWIRLVTGGALTIEEGSLYPALGRLERKGWITSDWGRSDANRKARFYQLTTSGRQELRRLAAEWNRYAEAMNTVLRHGAPRPWM